MRLPPQPKMVDRVRHSGRFWCVADMLEMLSIYHGCTEQTFPQTWRYRTLIAVHRAQHSNRPYGRGYGPDWKHHIKNEVVTYTLEGRLPLFALMIASEQIRAAEREMWIRKRYGEEADL